MLIGLPHNLLNMSGKIFLFLLCASITSYSQNLLRNGDFEEVRNTGITNLAPMNVDATDWFRVYSVDVYCVGNNSRHIQAESGENFIGLATYEATFVDYREYYVGTLTSPTLKNKPYLVSLYYALAGNSRLLCTDLHVFFADSLQENFTTVNKMSVTDTLIIPLRKNIRGNEWQLFTDTIYSTKISRYLGVGNLLNDKQIKVFKRSKKYQNPDTYIYFDNISVTPLFEDKKDSVINFTKKDTIQITEDSILSFKNIIFQSNSSIVEENFLPKIEFIAKYLNNTTYKVMLKGFTDNVGSEQYNLALSEKRVLAIRQAFIDNQVDSAKIQTSYFGESNSLNQNAFENDRLENRRVEILLIK
jgi:outer membrane protein OmpA-like peptidoglycan-associated protein